MSKAYSLGKRNGFFRQKILFCLSCVFIYPIFRKSYYEKMAQETIESLAMLRDNLIKIVRYRQNSVAVLYIKYHKSLPKIIDELTKNILEQEINIYSFNNVELEIEGLIQLINSNLSYNHQMALDYQRVLTGSEQEYNNIIQAYHSHYSKLMRTMKRFPGNFLFKIYNIKELELMY